MATINGIGGSSLETTQDQLISIFDKVTHGIGLSKIEQSLLRSSAAATPSLSERAWACFLTPSDDSSVQGIEALSQRILKKDAPIDKVSSQALQRFQSCQQPSIRETAAFAKLINSYLAREDIFPSVLSKFQSEKGRNPTRKELIDLVAKYNKAAASHIEYAGQVVAEIGYFNDRLDQEGLLAVRYNAEGLLEITEGPVAPLDTRFQQTLAESQIIEMKGLYESLSKDTPYNNLGELLEFIKYFNELKKNNSEVTLRQAFASYHPDLSQIFDEYHSGTCTLLSSKFSDELAKRGVTAQIMSTLALNPWTSLPIPGKEVEIRWQPLTQELKGVEHSDVVCFFKDEKGAEKILRFRCSFDKEEQDEVKEYKSTRKDSALKILSFETGDTEVPDRVIDNSLIGKTRLLGRHKALIKKDDMILGIDFLRGNLYFKPMPGSESMKGLPLNQQGRVSIDIADIANPEAIGIYFINGQKVEISHRMALRIVLEKAGEHVHLPSDVEENMIALAQNGSEFVNDFLMQPMPLMKQVFPDLLGIDKRLKELNGKITPDILSTLKDKAEEVIDAVCLNKEYAAKIVQEFRAELESLKTL